MGQGAGAARREPASVRQGRTATRAQDGTCDLCCSHASASAGKSSPGLCHSWHCAVKLRSKNRIVASMPTTIADQAAIEAAARLLERGELVAFPTETVYGLGADAENAAAVARIYAAKGRPSNHPVIVHLARDADIAYWAEQISDDARKLIDAYWPGPLTLILKRAGHIPAAVSGGQDSIGLRCPSHPVAQALLRAFKQGRGGFVVPSAFLFGLVCLSTADHVRDEFGVGSESPVSCILEGGQSEVGIESTILDLSRPARGPVLLRPGRIDAESIARVLGVMPASPDASAPRASGTLEAHYAPHTPVALIAACDLAATLLNLSLTGRRVALLDYSQQSGANAFAGKIEARISLPPTPDGYAHGLYAATLAEDRRWRSALPRAVRTGCGIVE